MRVASFRAGRERLELLYAGRNGYIGYAMCHIIFYAINREAVDSKQILYTYFRALDLSNHHRYSRSYASFKEIIGNESSKRAGSFSSIIIGN